MKHIQGINRDQMTLFPEALDDYIAEDNTVRFLDAFVDTLDFTSLGFEHAIPEETGRPPYDPADLLRLYLYGYLNRIRSSRQLERESHRNVEVMWLLRRLTPDFKTIADFRRNNRSPIQQVCRQFTLFCRNADLFSGDLVAIDGSKFKAVNSRARNISQRKLKILIQELDADIERYLDELDENDEDEPDGPRPTKEELQQKIEEMKRERAKAKELEKKLKNSGQTQISLTDPDSRSMPVSGDRRTDVSYNVQVAVDSKHKLIVYHQVTNAVTDRDLLAPMAMRAKEALGVDELEVLADMGYYHGKQVKRCLEAGITPYLPKPRTSASRKHGLFAKDDFIYDAENDCYRCPAGETLTLRFQTTDKERDIKYYATSACRRCSIRGKCTRSKDGRRITRWIDEDLLDEMERRVRGSPQKMKHRKRLAEHPFGTIKRAWNQGYFLTKGLQNVGAEMSLTILAYNIKRVVKVLGVPRMVEALA
ncbi:MAG: IS1182 family transposase [Anaerolineales bacterium]|jgi:transposase